MGCGAKEESEKNNKEKKRERGRGGNVQFPRSHPYSSPSLFFFSAHISLRSPHNLNAWSRLPAKKGSPVFTVFLCIKTSSQNISITLLQISLKLHNSRIRQHSNIKTRPSLYCIFYFFDLLHEGSSTIKGAVCVSSARTWAEHLRKFYGQVVGPYTTYELFVL